MAGFHWILELFGIWLDVSDTCWNHNFKSTCSSWYFEDDDGLKVPPGVCNARRLCVWRVCRAVQVVNHRGLAPGILEPRARTGASLQPLQQTHFSHLPVHLGHLAVHTSLFLLYCILFNKKTIWSRSKTTMLGSLCDFSADLQDFCWVKGDLHMTRFRSCWITFPQNQWQWNTFVGSECALNVLWVFSECSLSVLWVFSQRSLCDLSVISDWSLTDLWEFSECSLSVLWVFSECSLSDLWVISGCSLNVPRVCPEYAQSVPRVGLE